jgi:hypothetical protein
MYSGFRIAAAICFLLLFSSAAFATGPSSITVQISPIAANHSGQVLFRTFYDMNRSGGHSFSRSEIRFGWLIVSAQGLWKEYKHAEVIAVEGGADEDDHLLKMFKRYMNEFEAPFDWANPPASVHPILKTYKFDRAHAVDPNLGKGAVNWTPKGVYSKGKLIARGASQLTLGRKSSVRGTGSEVEAAFHVRGVALFHNENSFDTKNMGDHGTVGAEFPFPNLMYLGEKEGTQDVGFDTWRADGISLLKQPRSKPRE